MKKPFFSLINSGLPTQHATLGPATAAYYATASAGEGLTSAGPSSPTKYHLGPEGSNPNGGQETFSDFVTLVCQEAQGSQMPPGSHPTSSQAAAAAVAQAAVAKLSSAKPPPYLSPGGGGAVMYPPPPPPPIARPVTLLQQQPRDPPSPESHQVRRREIFTYTRLEPLLRVRI